MICINGWDGFVHADGTIRNEAYGALIPSVDDLADMVYRICENSRYAYQEEINKGFVTIRGGHRIGLVGTPVIDNERIINIRDISSLNIRIAREIVGCGDNAVKHLINGCRDIYNTLIISPPGGGKTTLLRDIVRLLSNGFKPGFHGLKVGIVDERGEIAACYKGIPQNDLGVRTDVIDGVHKKEGMEILLRSMSPNVIALDELGNPADVSTVMQVMNAGVRIIATAHGYNVNQLKNRQGFRELFQHNAFDRFIVIDDRDKVCKIIILDGDENVLAMDSQRGRKHIYHNEFNNGRVCAFPEAYRKDGYYTGDSGVSDGT
jgi:stage III sporulation protein AA